MRWRDYLRGVKEPGARTAWAVAIAADALQVVAFPLFAEGALSGFDVALDMAVGVLMVRLLGWHWALLPTLATELIPGADLFPTWTAAVWFVTRARARNVGEAEVLPPGPAPAPRQ